MNLKDLLIKTTIEDGCKDLICLPSEDRLKLGFMEDFTDYAKACHGHKNLMTRDFYSSYSIKVIDSSKNMIFGGYPTNKHWGICPSFNLDLQTVNLFENSGVKQVNSKKTYYTISFKDICYPNTIAKNSSELEQEFSITNSKDFIVTGKSYYGMHNHKERIVEYEYKGERYVRVKASPGDKGIVFSDGSSNIRGCYYWFKVEPINFVIENYKKVLDLTTLTFKDDIGELQLHTEQAIMSGIPYYINDTNTRWQNSLIRAYLNGYDLRQEILSGNGNRDLITKANLNFAGKGFIDEVFGGIEIANFEEYQSKKAQRDLERKLVVEKRKVVDPYFLKVDEKPLSLKDQLKFYIEEGMSFMLHGPSGIGKSRRVEELSPDCATIILRKDMLPEEVMGKTAYENGLASWIPPTWYTKLCDDCKREPDRYHVLFIDELTNVPESTQSLIYHLALENTIEPGRGELPKNCVVIAAGNSPEESDAAYNMPEPLFRRFNAHIYLKLDLKSWLEWGSELRPDGKQKIHPLVAGFVSAHADKVFYTKYDPENPPKYAHDPRGWEQVSNIIYSCKGNLRPKLIEDKIGSKMTTAFVDYIKKTRMTIYDVMNDTFNSSDLPKTANDKYALTCALRIADENQVEKVRMFIEEYLGDEYLAMFDSLWIEDNDERAILIDSLNSTKKEKKTAKSQKNKEDEQTEFIKSLYDYIVELE